MNAKLPPDIAEAILETLPLEMTVIDENDRIVWWNTRRTRVFARPDEVLGRDMRSCHSEKSLDMIETLLREMKSGERESARFWYDRTVNGVQQKLLVEYIAIRDGSGRYIGCLETLEVMVPFHTLEGERRTLDE